MIKTFKYRLLTLIVFCVYIFWGQFGIDLTLHPDSERFPLHRAFILFTAFIFLFNAQQVLVTCLKNKLLIGLLLYVLFTATWAYSPSDTIKTFVFLFSSMFISILAALGYNDNRMTLIRWLFWLFLLMTLASIITALYFPQIGINTEHFGKPRWVGITTHPNGLGVQGLLLIWLSSNLFFLSKSSIEKAIILFAIFIAFYIIIKADSMTSMITSLVIASYACYCYLFKQLSLPLKVILCTVSLLSFLFIIAFYMSTSELTNATITSTGRDATFTGRTVLWEKALISAADNLIFGYGFDSLQQLTKKYHIVMSHLHNGYIQVLVSGGMIACTLLAFILVKTFFIQLRIKSTYEHDFIFLNTGLVMVLLHNITESSILRGLNPLDIFLTFIIVSTSLIPENNKAAQIGQ